MKKIYTDDFKLACDPGFKFRYMAFQLQTGRWVRLYATNKGTVEKLLKKYQPMNAYQSLTKFSCPLQVFRKDRAVSNFISTEILLDFDDFNPINIIKTLSCMDYLKYTLIRAGLTSERGLHLIYQPQTPCVTMEKLMILRQLNACGCHIDSVNFDIKRVSRMLGTYNGNKENWGKEVLPSEIGSFLEAMTNSALYKSAKGVRELSPASPYFYLFASSKIKGTSDRHILVLRYKNYNRKKLLRLQETYGLDELYSLYDGLVYTIVCLESLPWKRIQKITRNSGSMEVKDVAKYSQRFWKLGQKFTMENGLVGNPIRLVEVLKSQKNSAHISKFIRTHVSLGHKRLLEKLIGKTLPDRIGSDKEIPVMIPVMR